MHIQIFQIDSKFLAQFANVTSSKSVFETLMNKPSNGGKAIGSSIFSRAEGWTAEAQVSQRAKKKPMVIEEYS